MGCKQPELCGEDHCRESEGGVQVEEEYTEVQPGDVFLFLGSLLEEGPYLRSHSRCLLALQKMTRVIFLTAEVAMVVLTEAEFE